MKKNVLLVEYDTTTIDLIHDILVSPVFEIETADEGEKAKELVNKKNYDLVITAAMLPKFHGFNLSQYIGNKSPNTKIIIISGIYKEIEYKHQALTQYKADDFFEKPLDKNTFKKRIMDLLDLKDKDFDMELNAPATRVPLNDTTKIPAVKESSDEQSKFTSNDLFGDIIEKVEKIPAQEIKFPDEDKKAVKIKKEIAVKKIDIDKQKRIELELESLRKSKKETPDINKFKKIEDDISKKLEDTLSGLGIKHKTPPKIEETKKEKEADASEQKSGATKKPSKEESPPVKAPAKKDDELGDYDILGLIARGGMAEIYKAKKKGVKGFEKVIAIKKILSGYGEDDKYIEMFVDEAKIAAELSHPNIVQIYDLGKKDDYYFIAMEYVQGKDLRLILKKLKEQDKWIPEEIAIYLIIKVMEALSYAHSAKDNQGRNLEIVHRDISPPNILISFGGEVKLTDFGVSKASIKIHQTISGALKGKLLYMSPEQAKGDRNIDYRADLFSAGVIFFELITGEKLFLDSSEMGVLKKVQNGIIIPPGDIKKDIDPELEAIILKSLNKYKDSRYQNATEMINDLEAYMHKNYDHLPTSSHISHFLYDLFQNEIKKENIEVDLKPLPYKVTRKISKPEQKIQPESKPEGKVKKARETPEQDESEDFVPTIEIDFEDPKPIKKHGKPVDEEPKTQPEPLTGKEKKINKLPFIEYDDEDLNDEKKKKKFLLFGILFMVFVAVALGTYFLSFDPKSKPAEPLRKNEPVQASNKLETTTDTNPQLIEKPYEVIIPGNETQSDNSDTLIEDQKSEDTVPVSLDENASQPEPVKKESVTVTPKLKQTSQAIKKTQSEKSSEDKITPTELTESDTEKIEKEKNQAREKSETTEKKPEGKQNKETGTTPVKIATEGEIVASSILDVKPIAISTPLPRVHRKTRRTLASDQNLLVNILIDHNGNIEKIKLLRKSSSAEINSLIISSIAKWEYKPAKKDKVRVKTWKQIPITIKKYKE
ncbi:MAG: protein kinase [Candidatus Aminicenantes bacterium]|nr:protein kinase [Candidatus Aminicenantes bacterium]